MQLTFPNFVFFFRIFYFALVTKLVSIKPGPGQMYFVNINYFWYVLLVLFLQRVGNFPIYFILFIESLQTFQLY